MASEKRYGVFSKHTHEEVHGTGAESKEDMLRWCEAVPGFYVGITAVTENDRKTGYVSAPN